MNEAREYELISKKWALLCMMVSLLIAIVCNETIAKGSGKAVFLGTFVTTFIIKSFWRQRKDAWVIYFFVSVAIFHFVLIFLMPNDDRYPGGLLLPIGVLDIAVFYLIFVVLAKQKAHTY